MKKILLASLITLLLIPTLANASFFGISWYKDYKVEKNISESIVAGETDTIIVSFKNPTPSMGTLIAGLEVKEETEEHPIWLGDFRVKARLNSTSLYPPNISSSYEMNCIERTNGSFYCFNLTEIKDLSCFTFRKFNFTICFDFNDDKWKLFKPEGSFIVLPGSKNKLTFFVTFNPALIPSNYTFNVSLYNDIFIPLIDDPVSNSTKAGKPTLFDSSEADTLLWITTSEDKNLSVDVTLYQYFLEESFIPSGLFPIKFIGIEANDTNNITSTEIWVYYKDDEIPSWIDENSLRLYYYDTSRDNPDEWEWKLLDSGVNTRENYVWAKTNHLSLFGIFGSPSIKKEVVYVRKEGGGGGVSVRETTTTLSTTTTVPLTTTTVQPMSIKTTTIPEEVSPSVTGPITGFFALARGTIIKYWYLPVLVMILSSIFLLKKYVKSVK